MNTQIKEIATNIQKKIPRCEDPREFIQELLPEIVEFSDEDRDPENTLPFFIQSREEAFENLITNSSELKRKIKNDEYELKGIISFVNSHWYAQIPLYDNSGKEEWFSCGRFAALATDQDLTQIIDDEAIVEERPLDLSAKLQILVYKRRVNP